MTVINKDFTSTGDISAEVVVSKNDTFKITTTGAGVGVLRLQRSTDINVWHDMDIINTNSVYELSETANNARYRVIATTVESGTVTMRFLKTSTTFNKSLKILMITDSMGARSYAWDDMYPSIFIDLLNENGVNCTGDTIAVNAHSYYRINTEDTFDGRTCLEFALEHKPDVVIVTAGVNDVISDIDSRTLEQVKTDATETYATLRSSLPNSEIYYASQVAYDNVNFTGAGLSGLKNKGVAPSLMEFKSSGILQGAYTSQILEDTASSATISNIQDFESLDAHVKSLSTIDNSVDFDTFKIARLGLLGTDGLHFQNEGQKLIASSLLSRLEQINAPFLKNLADQKIPTWGDPDDIFNDFLTGSGDGWVTSWPAVNASAATNANLGSKIKPDVWFYPYKSVFNFSPTKVTNDTALTSQFTWRVIGALPLSNVQLSLGGGAFSNAARYNDGVNIVTDINGDASDTASVGPIGLPNGTYELYFKIGIEIFGPYSLELAATVP